MHPCLMVVNDFKTTWSTTIDAHNSTNPTYHKREDEEQPHCTSNNSSVVPNKATTLNRRLLHADGQRSTLSNEVLRVDEDNF